MSTELSLGCRCGRVRGRAVEVSPPSSNQVVCYCKDCRAFARWLGRMEILDEAGGTLIVQLARGRVLIDEGIDQLACLRLSDKGLHRWYAACCRTPVGNTIPKVPFIGLIGAFVDPDDARRAGAFPPLVRVHTKSAMGPLPPGGAAAFPMYLRVVRLLLGWRIRRLYGDALFDPRTCAPRVPPQVLTPAERDAIRD